MASLGPADVQAAFDAAIDGDLEALVGLFDDDLDWTGLQRGHLWWRHAPA
jgi:ketosteroid isomerase-like protein